MLMNPNGRGGMRGETLMDKKDRTFPRELIRATKMTPFVDPKLEPIGIPETYRIYPY
jgi:hypothetical protein